MKMFPLRGLSILCIFALIVLHLNPLSANAVELTNQSSNNNDDVYSFTITSAKASRIDTSNYSEFTTIELIDVVLSESTIINCALYYGSNGSNYSLARELSPALQELETRDDAAWLLMQKYSDLSNSSSDYSTNAILCAYIELLLSHEPYNMSLDTQDSETIQESLSSSTIVTASEYYIANGIYYNYSTSTTTIGCLNIDLYDAQSEYTSSQKSSIQASTLAAFPDITALGLPTTAYNCHSYAWYYQSTANPYWIFDIENYTIDVHTNELTSGNWSDCKSGDIIVYYGSDGLPVHSAVIKSVSGSSVTCISKWGADGLYQHNAGDVPANYFYNYNSGVLKMDVYRLTGHTLSVVSKNATTHTQECRICPKTITETHTFDLLTNKCKTCSYLKSGEIQPYKKQEPDDIT